MGLFSPPEENLIKKMAPTGAIKARQVVDIAKECVASSAPNRTFVIQLVLATWLKGEGPAGVHGLTPYAWANFIDTANRFRARLKPYEQLAVAAAVKRLDNSGFADGQIGST